MHAQSSNERRAEKRLWPGLDHRADLDVRDGLRLRAREVDRDLLAGDPGQRAVGVAAVGRPVGRLGLVDRERLARAVTGRGRTLRRRGPVRAAAARSRVLPAALQVGAEPVEAVTLRHDQEVVLGRGRSGRRRRG